MSNFQSIKVLGYIGNIFSVSGDAIVNSANKEPSFANNNSLDAQIFLKAGPNLLRERRENGVLNVGETIITKSYNLKPYRHIIHVNVPRYNATSSKNVWYMKTLCKCYYDIILQSINHGINSVVIPLLGTGYKNYPIEWSLFCFELAFTTLNKMLISSKELTIHLVLSESAGDAIWRISLNVVATSLPVVCSINYTKLSSNSSDDSFHADYMKGKRSDRLANAERVFLENHTDDTNNLPYNPYNISRVTEGFNSLLSPFHRAILNIKSNIKVIDVCKLMNISTSKYYRDISSDCLDRNTIIQYGMAYDLLATDCNDLLIAAGQNPLDETDPYDKKLISIIDKEDFSSLMKFLNSHPIR